MTASVRDVGHRGRAALPTSSVPDRDRRSRWASRTTDRGSGPSSDYPRLGSLAPHEGRGPGPTLDPSLGVGVVSDPDPTCGVSVRLGYDPSLPAHLRPLCIPCRAGTAFHSRPPPPRSALPASYTPRQRNAGDVVRRRETALGRRREPGHNPRPTSVRPTSHPRESVRENLGRSVLKPGPDGGVLSLHLDPKGRAFV